MNNNALVVFSGGQDSTTCLYWALKNFEEVVAVSFDYGQRHKTELDMAREICINEGIQHEVIDVGLLNDLTVNSLTRPDMEIEQKEGELPNTFVDGRNMLFLTFAAVIAKRKGIHNIVAGVCQTDFSGYPDCRNVFIKSLNTTLNLAMDFEFEVLTPLMFLNKEQTWKMAYDLGVLDLIRHNTITCYNGLVGDGCGECPACKLRKRGLESFLESIKEAE